MYLTELRAPFFTASVVPILLGTVIAWAHTGQLHWGYFLLALLAGTALHAGTNMANDYFDHLSGNDPINLEFVRPFTGGSRLIQRGLLSPGEVLRESLGFFALGGLIGLFLAWTRGPAVLVLGAIGVFSGYFYSAPPFRLANLGIGEMLVGLNFGILMSLGAYYVQAQSLAWEPVTAGVPVALLIAAVLYINEFPDYEADRAVGKNHLVVRLGKKRGVKGYAAIQVAAYLSIIAAVGSKALPTFALLAILPLPLSLKAIKTALSHYGQSSALVPANALTIRVHLLVGLLLCLGYVLDVIVY